MLPYRQKLQMIFQDPYASLNPRFTVGEIIEEPMVIHHMYDEKKAKKTRAGAAGNGWIKTGPHPKISA